MHNKPYQFLRLTSPPYCKFMDPFLHSPFYLISSLFAFLVFIFFVVKRHSTYGRQGIVLPEAGGAWPFIGHMHLLGPNQLTHYTLGTMADKYGPAFTIKLGSHKVMVLSNWEMAKECFHTHDKNFAEKPAVLASNLLGYNSAMFAIAPYGSYWRKIRKIVSLELLSVRRIEMLKGLRVSEVQTSIREVYKLWVESGSNRHGVLVDMKQLFANITHNLIMAMVAGKRYYGGRANGKEGEAQKFEKMMRKFGYLFGVFLFSDSIPFLKWLDSRAHKRDMKRTAQELDDFIQGWLEEHKQKRLVRGEGPEGDEDFMDVMLTILNDVEIAGFNADTINKATSLNLILAGSDSTTVALIWAVCLLLNNRHILDKAQAELDNIVGKDRHVDESDIKNLVYLQAIVKETLRLCPPSPVIPLRSAINDCIIKPGYNISAGTRVMVNIWKIHRDASVWSEPNEYKPDRFLTTHKDIDVKGRNFELIPFGSGRRSCPGSALALQSLHLALASFIHCFDMTNISSEDVDMTESFGLTNFKATPLQVFLLPRLQPGLYL
ncbi:cytochrome P450 CYP82D47-like [Daucus carota subsp. sativus]|nr:PREDICTED: cytochrome P450 CYP82D47-like [Daucus carota subsp. sativus]